MKKVDADALKEEIRKVVEEERPLDERWAAGLKYSIKIIDNAPAVEPDRPQSEWIYREEWFEDEEKPRMAWGCNLCGHSIKSVHEKLNFCSNCGAAMKSAEEEALNE